MTSTPLLSVIIPVYRVEEYLPRCVESVLNQSYTNLEVVLVDDGSTDNSGALCDAYARQDKRIKVVHKSNGGLSSARNAGLAVITGDFVTFVDSDDWIEEYAYETLMKPFAEDASLDIVRAEYHEIYPDRVEEHSSPFGQATTLSGQEVFNIFCMDDEFQPVVWSSVYRVACLDAIQLRFIERVSYEDVFFTLMLYGCSPNMRLHYTPTIVYNYRRDRQGAITSEKWTIKHLEHFVVGFIQVYNSFMQYAPANIPRINRYITRFVEHLTLAYLSARYSWRELYRVLKPLLVRSRQYPLLEEPETWLLKLFLFSPRLAYTCGRIYQPIARRLGISQRYR